jgi:hypothetical protein
MSKAAIAGLMNAEMVLKVRQPWDLEPFLRSMALESDADNPS